MLDHVNRPCAATGLVSYRCRSRYGWIMIGATDHVDAMREARRSDLGAHAEHLEIWTVDGYRPVTAGGD